MMIYTQKSKTLLFLLLIISNVQEVQGYAYKMICGTTWPASAMSAGNLGNMGTSVNVASTANSITINSVAYTTGTGSYTPSSTVTISLSKLLSNTQAVYQATNAVFQGVAGANNKNGLITNSGTTCSGISRYQQYGIGNVAQLLLPASGTVTIEANYAITSGTGKTSIPTKVVLSPTASPSTSPPTYTPSKIPTKSPVFAPTPVPLFPGAPTFKPTSTSSPTVKPTDSPTRKPTVKPSLVSVYSPTLTPTSKEGGTSGSTTKSSSSSQWTNQKKISTVIGGIVVGLVILMLFIMYLSCVAHKNQESYARISNNAATTSSNNARA